VPEETPHPVGSLSRRAVVAFGRFWWDFFVGDGPELLIGVVVAMGAVALLVAVGAPRALTVAALPVLTAGLLTTSVARGRRRA
jgi:hypothetical protein